MQNLRIDEDDLERRRRATGLSPHDLERIASVRATIERHADELTTSFFEALAGLEGARVLLSYRELLDQAKALKREHLLAMVQGRYDLAYVEQRIRLGLLYGRVGLETRAFLGAFQTLLANMARVIQRDERVPSEQALEMYLSVQRIAFFDIGIMVDVLIHERERTISIQSEAIRELSTPVLQIRDRLLLLPLIGVIDTHRAKLITENMLVAIRRNRARVVVMDVTGVPTIDSRVANHLLQTVNAARLMGAVVILSGVSAEVAQSMVAIGVEISQFTTVGDLQSGVEDAERMLGYRVVAEEE